MKANVLIATAMAIAVIFTPLFLALYIQNNSTNIVERDYSALSDQEIINMPIEELASLRFETLITLSNRFNSFHDGELSTINYQDYIDLPIEILADLKFNTLIAFTDIACIANICDDKYTGTNILLPITAVADVDFGELIDLTNLYSSSMQCDDTSMKNTDAEIVAILEDRWGIVGGK